MILTRTELLANLEVLSQTLPDELDVTDLVTDSRDVLLGAVFAAVRGDHNDGHDFVHQALAAGAAAAIVDQQEAFADTRNVVVVPDTRKALGILASNVFRNPSSAIDLIGVTGTNGKTSTTYILEAALRACGIPCGIIGTIQASIGSHVYPLIHTTPEAPQLSRILRSMLERGATAVASEVSSHGIALGRIDGLNYSVGIYSNLSQDHLDFHKTMEEYGNVKKRFFTDFLAGSSRCKGAVINVDDAWGRTIASEFPRRCLRYGVTSPDCDLTAEDLHFGFNGMSFTARLGSTRLPVTSCLPGRHNVYNILSALGACFLLGLDLPSAISGVAGLRQVHGRLQAVENDLGAGIWVDYAHSPDALEKVLNTLRELVPGRLITVFGAGGDRDRAKRPIMGSVVSDLSDLSIVTSDNPRTEPPLSIIESILAGIPDTKRIDSTMVIPNRRIAIMAAVGLLRKGDGLLIAGKGHENYQILGTVKHHFDDLEVAREALSRTEGARP